MPGFKDSPGLADISEILFVETRNLLSTYLFNASIATNAPVIDI